MPDPTIAIVGGGRIGQALGRLLRDKQQPVVAVCCRTLESAERAASFIGDATEPVLLERIPALASHLLIATPDGAIAEVASRLADAGMRGGVALHTCGALGPGSLAPLAEQETACGLLHPLQTVPSPEAGLDALPGVAFSIDGSPAALDWASGIVDLLDGITLRIPEEKKTLYHAAAVMASNYTIALLDAAFDLMEQAGVSRDDARRALHPLVASSVSNTFKRSPEQALTGPIRRGDTETVSAHLASLPSSHDRLYRGLGLHAVSLARRAGLDQAAGLQLAKLLRENGDEDV